MIRSISHPVEHIGGEIRHPKGGTDFQAMFKAAGLPAGSASVSQTPAPAAPEVTANAMPVFTDPLTGVTGESFFSALTGQAPPPLWYGMGAAGGNACAAQVKSAPASWMQPCDALAATPDAAWQSFTQNVIPSQVSLRGSSGVQVVGADGRAKLVPWSEVPAGWTLDQGNWLLKDGTSKTG